MRFSSGRVFVEIGLELYRDDKNIDGLRVIEKIRAAGDDDTSIVVVTGRVGIDMVRIVRDAIRRFDVLDVISKRDVTAPDLRAALVEGLMQYQNKRSATVIRAVEI